MPVRKRKEKKKAEGFQILDINWSFSSYIMAVERVNSSKKHVCMAKHFVRSSVFSFLFFTGDVTWKPPTLNSQTPHKGDH